MNASALPNPALQAFLQALPEELLWAEVLIRRRNAGFELRHAQDRAADASLLQEVQLDEVRKLAQFTSDGAFRPLKSAPNLRRGWRLSLATPQSLEMAVNQLYPGSLADWFAARASPPVTHYREFTGRQTGMYRITQKLDDEQVADVIRACCAPNFCLKRRLWTVDGLSADESGENAKSLIPCLEPCAILLELARKAMRIEQEEKADLRLASSDLESALRALEIALARRPAGSREADLTDPANPRRLALALAKLRKLLPKESGSDSSESHSHSESHSNNHT